ADRDLHGSPPSRSGVVGLSTRLPLDVAADARALVRVRRAAREHGVGRGAQVAARHRDAVAGPAVVELPAVGEAALAVEEVELGRARGAEGLRDLLRLVDQVR